MKNNKRIKICILTSVHPVFDTRIFHKQAKTLAKAGYNVVLIAQHNKNETINEIKIIALPKPRNRFERFFKLDYLAYKKAFQQKADIYHFHDPELLPWMARLKKKTKTKVIYDIHENVQGQIFNKNWVPKFLRRFISFFYKIIEMNYLSTINKIILAESSYSVLYKNYKNTRVIRNFPLIPANINRDSVNPQPKSEKLVYVGGISKERGIFSMIHAVRILKKKFKKIQLIVAGQMEDAVKLEINSYIRRYSLYNDIVFLGKISHPKVIDLFSKMNIGLSVIHPISNYVNSLSTKLFEYMAAGLPVVASNFPLWKKTIEENNCGICVDPLKPKEIARAIKYLKDNPENAKKMGENGRKAVFKKYNWGIEEKKLLDIYEKLTKK